MPSGHVAPAKLLQVPEEFREFVRELVSLSPDGVSFSELFYELWEVKCYSRRGQLLQFQMERNYYSMRFSNGEEVDSGRVFPSGESLRNLLV